MNKNIKHILILVIALVALNFISNKVYKRFDLTADNRYTLSESATQIIEDIASPIVVDVFLEGDRKKELPLSNFLVLALLDNVGLFGDINGEWTFEFIILLLIFIALFLHWKNKTSGITKNDERTRPSCVQNGYL